MKIEPIALTGSDERGYSAEYRQERTGKQLLLFRKAGSVSGRHYHKGLSSAKNPEVFIVLHGSCIINWRLIQEDHLQTQKLEGPVRLEIPVDTWHEVIAITDCTFLEMNSIDEHIADTFYLDK